MKISELKVGDRLENYRTGTTIVVEKIEPWSGGNGDISFREGLTWARQRSMTFRQFERLKFIRRLGDRRIRLTEQQWRDVFKIRCRSKRGEAISASDLAMCEAALKDDPKRYSNSEVDVFNATVPFGSNVRRVRTP